MRYILSILLALSSWTAFATPLHSADSLLSLLKNNPTADQKIQIYRNLADIYFDSPNEKIYLVKLYQEAQKANNTEQAITALNDIIVYEANDYQKDSITKYIDLLKEIASADKIKSLLPYYHMRFFNTLFFLNKRNEAIEEELSFLATKNQGDDIYGKIASAYNTGNSLYLNKQIKEALPYLENAIKMAESLPEEEKYIYLKFMTGRLCFAYAQTKKNKDGIKLMDENIKRIEEIYKNHYQKQRPFHKIELHLLQPYSFMIANIPHMNKERETYYWNKIIQIRKNLDKPQDLYSYYLAVYNYHTINNNISKSLAINDSLIAYAKTLVPQQLPRLYELSSILLERKGDYQHALKYLKLSHEIADSLNHQSVQQQLSELQVKYDLNKLNGEKSELEIKNKQNLLIFLTVILITSILVCTYLFYSLRKEKHLKSELKKLNAMAHESEKMKQSFINSICHEIRTPLNAIVGFSDLIMSPEIDEETRREFPEEIQKNTKLLTSLVNSMLDVANLDVSEERLPCEPTNINHLCMQGIDILMGSRKTGINYILDIPKSEIIFPTHEKYLTTVVVHLLENANKFTTEGSITLACQMDTNKQALLITVTDTGCGIPDEKRDEVFMRFAKLDNFTPGNGLGLYLCRLIVKRLAGEITIDSQYKQGTRIIVSLPL